MTKWREFTLGDVTENYDSMRVPVKSLDRKPGPYPYYGASGIIDYIDDFILDGEYLLVAEDGENLRTRKTPIAFMAGGKFWVNNHAHIICGNHLADTRYLCYLLSVTDISGYLTGSTQPKLTQGNMNRIPLRLPPIDTQRWVVSVLDSLTNKIELNRRMNRTLEAIARAIFKSWFVDFDPVHAKAEGRDPVGMDPETAALFLDSFQDSPLGRIPEGWEVSKLEHLLDLSRESVKPLEHPTEQFDHFSIPAFDAGEPCREVGVNIRSSKYLVPSLAVLISKLNPHLPRVWLPQLSDERRAICSTEFLVCVPKPCVSREYIYSLLSSRSFLDRFAQLVTGTTGSHQRVRPTAFVEMNAVTPPRNLLDAYAGNVSPLLRRINNLKTESSELADTRDALLPELLSGAVTATIQEEMRA